MMRICFARGLIAIFTLALSFVLNVGDAKAGDVESSQEITEKINSKIKFKNPFTIAESPVDGYYKIHFFGDWGKHLFFNKDVTVFGNGPYWSKITGHNAAAQISSKNEIFDIRTDVLRRIKKEYLIGPYGNGSRVVIVYTAPECPFCQSFDELMLSIAKKYDITFYIMPVSLKVDSGAYLASMWCTDDPEKAWRGSMKNRRAGKSNHCDKSKTIMSIDQMFFKDFHSKEVKMLTIPSFIFEDGTVKPGFGSDHVAEMFQSR